MNSACSSDTDWAVLIEALLVLNLMAFLIFSRALFFLFPDFPRGGGGWLFLCSGSTLLWWWPSFSLSWLCCGRLEGVAHMWANAFFFVFERIWQGCVSECLPDQTYQKVNLYCSTFVRVFGGVGFWIFLVLHTTSGLWLKPALTLTLTINYLRSQLQLPQVGLRPERGVATRCGFPAKNARTSHSDSSVLPFCCASCFVLRKVTHMCQSRIRALRPPAVFA